MEHKAIKHLQVGDVFEDIYYVENISSKEAKNGNIYTDFTLKDASGSAYARFWGAVEDISVGVFMAASIVVEEYNKLPQIIIKSCGQIDKPEDMTPFTSVSLTKEKDKEIFNKILKSIEDLCVKNGNDYCIRVLKEIFRDSLLNEFFIAPYGVLPFYGKEGGIIGSYGENRKFDQ